MTCTVQLTSIYTNFLEGGRSKAPLDSPPPVLFSLPQLFIKRYFTLFQLSFDFNPYYMVVNSLVSFQGYNYSILDLVLKNLIKHTFVYYVFPYLANSHFFCGIKLLQYNLLAGSGLIDLMSLCTYSSMLT